MCVCSPTRLHVLMPIEARLADCRGGKLTFCQQLLMNEEVGLVPKETRPIIRGDYYKPLTLETMQIAYIHTSPYLTSLTSMNDE